MKRSLATVFLVGALVAGQRSWAQLPSTRQTLLAAYVSPQAHIDVPSYILFRPGDTTCTAVARLWSIVYPDSASRVRLMVAAADESEARVSWDAGGWESATGTAGRLSATFQPFALGAPYASSFAGSAQFRLDQTPVAPVMIQLHWKLEWVE
jgi:hypothetical protein